MPSHESAPRRWGVGRLVLDDTPTDPRRPAPRNPDAGWRNTIVRGPGTKPGLAPDRSGGRPRAKLDFRPVDGEDFLYNRTRPVLPFDLATFCSSLATFAGDPGGCGGGIATGRGDVACPTGS